MISFLLKGLFRDRSRSVVPLLIVTVSVAVVVLAEAYVRGAMGDIVEVNARFEAGHVKVMTRAYKEQASLRPNDLALMGIDKISGDLERLDPRYTWHPRIKFGGLFDFPDAEGETKAQGVVAGIAADLLRPDGLEVDHLNLTDSVAQGRLPKAAGEVLVSDRFFRTLKLSLGQQGTLIASTMEGGTAVANFTVVGTVVFGVEAMDRGAMIAHLPDVQHALYMDDAASEILGFHSGGFDRGSAMALKHSFNNSQSPDDKFAPVMSSIMDNQIFGQYVELAEYMSSIIVIVFVFVVTIVLWNSSVRNGIRRYSEFGLRLAIGEDASHVYWSQPVESVFLGVTGSVLGTALGLLPAWHLQEVGLDISGMMDSTSSMMMMEDTIRAQITGTTLWIGFIPGVVSIVLGSLIAGVGMFRRSTAQLFKELEV